MALEGFVEREQHWLPFLRCCIFSHPFDFVNVENRIPELVMDTKKFKNQIDLLDADIENNLLSRLLQEVKEMIFR